MTPNSWIRLDVLWDKSEWLNALDGTAAGCWPRLLCWVKTNGRVGRCKRPALTVLAREWRVPVESVEAFEAAAIKDGALQVDDGDWVVSGWDDFQDGAAIQARERMRRMRERRRENIAATADDAEQEQTEDDFSPVPTVTDFVPLVTTAAAHNPEWAVIARTEVDAWNVDFPSTCKGLRNEFSDINAFVRLQRDEGKTVEDFAGYRAYLQRTDSIKYWRRPADLVRPTKQGTGQEVWAVLDDAIERELRPDPVAVPTHKAPVLYRPAWETEATVV